MVLTIQILKRWTQYALKIFGVNRLKTVTTHIVDMCVTSGTDASTAEGIFTAAGKVFAKSQNLWENCVSLSVDNTNTMIGKNYSIASRLLERKREMNMCS